MMTHGRHIRRDWQLFLDRSSGARVFALCGKRTKDKHLGVPSVTHQEIEVPTSVGIRPGWCVNCSAAAIGIINDVLEDSTVSYKVKELYNDAGKELVKCLEL